MRGSNVMRAIFVKAISSKANMRKTFAKGQKVCKPIPTSDKQIVAFVTAKEPRVSAVC